MHGTLLDYKYLHKICLKPKKNFNLLGDVSKEALDWVYPFCKHAIEIGTNVQVNSYIVQYYETLYNK